MADAVDDLGPIPAPIYTEPRMRVAFDGQRIEIAATLPGVAEVDLLISSLQGLRALLAALGAIDPKDATPHALY